MSILFPLFWHYRPNFFSELGSNTAVGSQHARAIIMVVFRFCCWCLSRPTFC
uniref:Uncharacterized protein n=1 Tax=Arundo donax TaxID=35708 RepID=A0A0A8ZT48_ARUDO